MASYKQLLADQSLEHFYVEMYDVAYPHREPVVWLVSALHAEGARRRCFNMSRDFLGVRIGEAEHAKLRKNG